MEIKTESVDIKYEIGDDIGRGKFATVKRCRDRQTGCEYAAKFIRKSLGTGRRGAKMENIEKEIQILSETNHRNIINLYEVYGTKREVILILELVDGGELFEHLSEKDKLCEEEASSFVKQILEGVEHLHSQDIAHLDLKPENILLQDKNSTAVKLIDFGLSRKILPKEDHRAIMGTAEFCGKNKSETSIRYKMAEIHAPEVISFEPLSVSTDMWSIGVITYVLLSGLSPFLGDNQQETYHNITSINFEFDEEYFNGTSELAKDFIQKLLVKDTRKRATIHQCLNHPWIKPVEKRDKVLRRSSVINTEHLKKFIARQRWKRSMKVVSLCNRLSRSMQLRRIMSSDTIGSTSEEDTDELTDTEKGASDRESTEREGAEMIHSIDKGNLSEYITDRESTEINNSGGESVEIHETKREYAEKIHSGDRKTPEVNITDRESTEIDNSGRESVEMHNTERESAEKIHSSDRESATNHVGESEDTEIHISDGKTAEIIHNSDNNMKELAKIHHIDGESTEIEKGNKESTEVYSSAKELSETHNSSKELAEIHNYDIEPCEIHNTVRETVEINKSERGHFEIRNNDREYSNIPTSDDKSAENHNSERGSADMRNTDKESSEFKDSTEIDDNDRESSGIRSKAADENHSLEVTHMKLFDNFDENNLESNLQKSSDLQIPESIKTGISEDIETVETSVTKTAEQEHPKTAETGTLESAELEQPTTTETGTLESAELEQPTTAETGSLESAELEQPTTTETGTVESAELEQPTTAETGSLECAELEQPTIAETGNLESAELEHPKTAETGTLESAELEQPTTTETGTVESAELEQPTTAETGTVESAELEQPTTAETGTLESAELEQPTTTETGTVESAELEQPTTAETGTLESAELEQPTITETGNLESAELECLKTAETGTLESAELEQLTTAETGTLESAEGDMSRTAESKSQSENKEISGICVLPETQCLEIVEHHNLDPNFVLKCIESEDNKLASRNVIGEFDDDIGQFVEGLNLDTENEVVKDYTSYEPPYEMSGIEIGAVAQKFVTGIIERSIGYYSDIEHKTVIKSTSLEGSLSSLKEKEKAKSHLKQYDPLKLVCFEIDEGPIEELVEEQNQIDKEKENDKAKFVGSEMENVHPDNTNGEKIQRSDEHNKLFKPLTTSKFNVGAKKYSVRRPVKRQRKVRPELKVKKKANRFWEMEDCDERGRYEMFEMQVLNNSE